MYSISDDFYIHFIQQICALDDAGISECVFAGYPRHGGIKMSCQRVTVIECLHYLLINGISMRKRGQHIFRNKIPPEFNRAF